MVKVRQGFDLEKLRQHGTIYGCNAIYRDFMPDVLTVVDMVLCMRYIMWQHKRYHVILEIGLKVPAMTYEQMLYGGQIN